MSIKSYLSKFLLNRKFNSGDNSSSKNYVFEKKLDELLIILPAHQDNLFQKGKLEKVGKPFFRHIDFLTISDVSTPPPDVTADLSIKDLNYKGRFSKKESNLAIKENYDLVVNLLHTNDPTIELFISHISSLLKIRFNRVNENFYNFIVPIENEDIFQRFEQFLKVYQTLKK